jgi:hypothetical protein
MPSKSLLPLLLVLSACASSRSIPEGERERLFVPSPAQASWTGRTLDEVLEVFGPPSDRSPDSTGGTVLTYQAVKPKDERLQPQERPAPGDPPIPRQPTDDVEVRRTNTAETKNQAQFWVDSQGKVTRFWFSKDMYRKGIPSPPAPPPPPGG